MSLWEVRRRLGSLKLTFVLLVSLAALFFLRAVVAEAPVQAGEVSWWSRWLTAVGLRGARDLELPFFVTLSLFVVNLNLSALRMGKRVRAKLKGARRARRLDRLRRMSPGVELPMGPRGSVDELRRFFERRHFKVISHSVGDDGGVQLVACRHHAGHWGVLLFHLALLVLVVGALLSVLTRQAGLFRLERGQTFVEGRSNYFAVTDEPTLFGGDRGFLLRLESLELAFWEPFASREIASVVSGSRRDGRSIPPTAIAMNDPLRVGDVVVYQGTKHGYIARVDAEDALGTQAQGTLTFDFPTAVDERMVATVTLPGTELELELELLTAQLAGIEGLEVLRDRHSKTTLVVTKIGRHGGRYSRGEVALGGVHDVEGIRLRFLSLESFTTFIAVRDYGTMPMFVGFVILVGGLLAIYFWVPETIWAESAGDAASEELVLVVVGSAERFRSSFEKRFAELVESLRKELETT